MATASKNTKATTHADTINKTVTNVENSLKLVYNTLPTDSSYNVSTCTDYSRSNYSTVKGTSQSWNSCKWNALQTYFNSNLEQDKAMKGMKVAYGLAVRTLNSEIDQYNLTVFDQSKINFTLPSNTNSPVFDNYLAYKPPSTVVNSVSQQYSSGSTTIEWFGYVVVQTSKGASAQISASIRSGAPKSPAETVLRTWYGSAAIVNYNFENSMGTMSGVFNGEIYPVRIQVYIKNATQPGTIRVVVSSSTSTDRVGLYCFLKDSKLFIKNEYLYALSPDEKGNNNNCKLYTTNAPLNNQTYITKTVLSFQYGAIASGTTISIQEKKDKSGNINGATLFISSVSSSSASKTTTTKKGSTTTTQTTNKDTKQYTVPGVPGYHVSNPTWKKAAMANSISTGSGSKTLPIYSENGYFSVSHTSSNKYITVYAYLKNPDCNNPKSQSTVQMRNLSISPGTNQYAVADRLTNTYTPVGLVDSSYKKKIDTRTYSNRHGDISQWDSYPNLKYASSTNLTKANSTSTINVNNVNNCLKFAASKGAYVANFVKTKKNVGDCYYGTNKPSNGIVSKDLLMESNNSSTLYIRKANTASMSNKSLSAMLIGDAYANKKVSDNIAKKVIWTDKYPVSRGGSTQTENSMINSTNKEASKIKEGFDCSRPPSGSTLTAGDLAIRASCLASTQGVSQSSGVSAINTALNDVNSQLNTLNSGYALSSGGFVGQPGLDTLLIPSDSLPARQVYNILHPNSPSTASDKYKQDSDEMRMQYNNLLVVGSIAAATFSIGAVVALSFR